MFTKEIALGSAGKLTVTEQGGQVTLSAQVNQTVGGGEASGVATLGAQVNLTLNGAQLLTLVKELVESKSPAGVKFIEDEAFNAAMAALQKA